MDKPTVITWCQQIVGLDSNFTRLQKRSLRRQTNEKSTAF
jgi:hypothetical protein